jgi:hypothetical protein
MPAPVIDPDACRYCDHPRAGHAWAWTSGPAAVHRWVAPNDVQRLERLGLTSGLRLDHRRAQAPGGGVFHDHARKGGLP